MPFNAALSGLQTSNSQLRILSHNIANASTTGFKKSRGEFRDVFAAGALGSSANIIGTGVKLTDVSQQFTQGIINSAETNLDLAINGPGFFVLNDDGSRVYSRSGAFRVDKDGIIANSQRQNLVGFLTDSNGNITGAQGDLQIQNSGLDPSATTTLTASINLNASASPPSIAFTTGFTQANPPSSTSFTNSTSTQIFDSLGQSHILTTYFVKAPADKEWHLFIDIDGVDVTPVPATEPVGGTANTPVAYGTGELAVPFTLIFDSSGNFVANNSASPPNSHGSATVTSSAALADLQAGQSLPTLEINELTVNGEPINVGAITENQSTNSPAASSITLASAINDKTAEHKVVATVNPNQISMTFTAGGAAPTLAGNDLVINGQQITGTMATNDVAGLVALISTNVPNVTAADAGGGVMTITSSDGRNIHITTGGGVVNGFNLDATVPSVYNFDTTGAGDAFVLRGTYTLSESNTQAKKIEIAGTNVTDAGLTAGVLRGIDQDNSDVISIASFNPGSGADLMNIAIDLSTCTSFASPFSITALTQNGYSTGRLTNVDVDPEGIITARYGNGQSQQLGQVALANFRNTQGLTPQGDTTWAETFSSGVALLGAPGTSDLGLIQSGSLEDSNVQLTDELVSLIVAQRNFQANAQTIRTADAVTQTIINIR